MQAFEAQSTRDLPRSQTLLPICHETELGICPTGEHLGDCRRCGFAGCVDLRPWAKANRYRFRLEESYGAESNTHVRGDGRWYVEILCKRGTIYPYGGPCMKSLMFSCTNVWIVTSCTHSSSSARVGSSPLMIR